MGIMDKMSRTFGLSSEEEKEMDTQEKEELTAPNFETKETPPANPAGYVGRNVVDFSSAMANRNDSVNNMMRTATMTKSKITTVKPTSFDDAQTVANCLRDKIPVIINFENTNTDDAKRIIDFISGTTYAINGEIKKVSQNVFVCAPSNVTVTYTEEDKKSGNGFSWLAN